MTARTGNKNLDLDKIKKTKITTLKINKEIENWKRIITILEMDAGVVVHTCNHSNEET